MILKPPLPRLRRSHPLTNGLVFAAPFYEGSGNKAHDISGRDNHGTLTNMDPNTDWVGSPHGWALDFDGSNDYSDFGNNIASQLTSGITVSAWVKMNVSSGRNDICGIWWDDGGLSNTQYKFLLTYGVTAQKFAFFWKVDSTGSFPSATSPSIYTDTSTWVNLVGTFDGLNGKLYANSVKLAESSAAGTLQLAANAGLRIGASRGGFYANVRVSGTAIYNRALSASEIAELYFNPAVIYEPPKKYWLFGSAAPQTLNPDPADYDWTVNDPTISAGAVTLSPDPAVFTWTANNPTITAGGVTLSPASAEFEWVANDAGISVEGDTTLFPEPAVWQWYAQSPSIEAIECEPLLGCRQSFFTYSIQAGIQPEPGDDCEVLSGCRLSFFTYQIED